MKALALHPPGAEAAPEEPSAIRIMAGTIAIGSFAAGLYITNALLAVARYHIPHPAIEIVTRLFAMFWLWAPLAPIAWWAAQRWPLAAGRLAPRLAIHLAIGLALWLAHALLFWGALNLREALDIAPVTLGVRWPPAKISQLVVLVDTDLAIYGMIVAASITWRNHARAVASRTWRDRVDSRRSTALLEALRRQLRPHFVLNALNMALSELATRPRRAKAVLGDLAELLESTERLEGHLVSLDAELDIVRAHAAIEQARFSDRLELQWDIAVPRDSVKVPPFSIQTLFENAVRHGLEQSPGRFTIAIEADSTPQGVRIRVRDSGGRIEPGETRGSGIALDNLRTRLALLFGEGASVTLFVQGSWTVAQLIVPAARP
ncbi:histidine kinase [Sphingomonas sp.]|uniref:sensor histidine kinase n=1 Tax=Sphingomonas sp. TaxID=28214 RepID=UPI001AFF0045|nr:histidine kinase [Sphingomonas sp.]MBO9713453.1 histidine kinase [Sphingomonas sp.]